MKALIEKVAPWVCGVAAIWMLVVPVVGYKVIHSTQTTNQHVLMTTAGQVSSLTKSFACVGKAMNGLLQDVPLAFIGDKVASHYAQITKECKVPQVPAK